MATIHDVARHAEVSVGTVSRVLRGAPNVRPNTRRAVESAIKELGFQPNALARGLRATRTGAIGVVISDLLNPTFAAIVHGIQRVANERGEVVLLCDAGGDVQSFDDHLRRLAEHRVDGVVFQPVSDYREQIAPLARAGIPTVIIGQRARSGPLPEIYIDEAAASRTAFTRLLALGHRRITLVVRGYGETPLPAYSSMPSRIAAFRAAYAEAGLAGRDGLVVWARDAASAEQQVRALLDEPNPPTAVVAGVQTFTPAVLRAITAAGRRVPDDVSVLAYGDSPWTEIVTPPLAVIRADYALYGRQAAHLLFALADGAAAEPVQVLTAEFVPRGSFAPPR